MKKLISLGVLLMMTHFPIGCGCGPFDPYVSNISELSSTIGSYSPAIFKDSLSADVNFAAIQIAVTNTDVFVAENNISFINSALACDPPGPVPNQRLESIVITSEATLFFREKLYPAGEDVSELFKVVRSAYSSTELTVPAFITEQNADPFLFGELSSNLVFQLNEEPDQSLETLLNFTFTFTDSESITLQTESFRVVI